MTDSTTLKLIVRYSSLDKARHEARISGVWTNLETAPWRSARISVDWSPDTDPRPTLEDYARERIRHMNRAWLELCGANGERRAIAELKADAELMQISLFPVPSDATTINLIARTPKNFECQVSHEIFGTWTNVETAPWRTQSFSGGLTFERYVQRRIDEDGDRVWLELCGPEGERRGVAELTTHQGGVRMLREPSEPGPMKRYDPNGRRFATLHAFKPRQLG
jgi:hypothetical protein